jgi:hypothetical protein
VTTAPVPIVFLTGCQRSGTTALAVALSAAYERDGRLFTVNGKLPYVLHRWLSQSDIDGMHLRCDEIIHALRRRNPYGTAAELWLESASTALCAHAERLARDDPSLPRGIDDLAVRIMADSYGADGGWGDKYNEYMTDLDALRPLLPNVKVLLLVRHPIQVAESMLAWLPRRAWCPTTSESVQVKWTRWHEQFFSHPLLGSIPLLVVDYAELATVQVSHRISDFCRLNTAIEQGALRPRHAAIVQSPLPPADRLWSRLRQLADSPEALSWR